MSSLFVQAFNTVNLMEHYCMFLDFIFPLQRKEGLKFKIFTECVLTYVKRRLAVTGPKQSYIANS